VQPAVPLPGTSSWWQLQLRPTALPSWASDTTAIVVKGGNVLQGGRIVKCKIYSEMFCPRLESRWKGKLREANAEVTSSSRVLAERERDLTKVLLNLRTAWWGKQSVLVRPNLFQTKHSSRMMIISHMGCPSRHHPCRPHSLYILGNICTWNSCLRRSRPHCSY